MLDFDLNDYYFVYVKLCLTRYDHHLLCYYNMQFRVHISFAASLSSFFASVKVRKKHIGRSDSPRVYPDIITWIGVNLRLRVGSNDLPSSFEISTVLDSRLV